VTGRARGYVRAPPRPAARAAPALPIRVAGYLSASHGIGASARLAVRAFEALGAPVETVELAGDSSDWKRRLARPTPGLWIFHLNPPELLWALACLGARQVTGLRYGFWAWELPQAPARWRADARLVDEVWAPSRYTAEALAGARAPVRVVPHPLFLEDYRGITPEPRQAAFQAVALFDFNSSAARKHPEGAIEAFRRAFGDDPGCELVLKTQNGGRFPAALAALKARAGGNVRIIDEVWPYARVKALIAGADALLSLHRAEGFGLTVAEAMALGTPAVATAFSGVLDFADEDCAALVPWRPVAVDDPHGIYRGQSWADPDLDAAAAALRRLREDRAYAGRLAQAGPAAVEARLSPQAWLRSLPSPVQMAVQSS
jgi:glycosyltransferase involved in cell wall biosynthesis